MAIFNSIVPSFNRAPAQRADSDSEKPGVRPIYEINETNDGWTATVYLPGVARDGLSITDENGTLTIRGERSWRQPSDWTSLYRESRDIPFVLHLDHENGVDAEKIQADLKDGVLRLQLPKTEARKPRKIAIA